MNEIRYKIAVIYKESVHDKTTWGYTTYKDAYADAIEIMELDLHCVSCLIYSNNNTAIVIKRKHII